LQLLWIAEYVAEATLVHSPIVAPAQRAMVRPGRSPLGGAIVRPGRSPLSGAISPTGHSP
jgi:hypothetical protein